MRNLKSKFLTLSMITIALSVMSIPSVGFSKNKKLEKKNIQQIAKNVQMMVLKTTKVGARVTHLMDYTGNSKADAEITLIGEKVFSEKLDYNKDGKFDKQIWKYETGEVLSLTTVDKNFDGKVDYKEVDTLKNAPAGHFINIVYRDKDFDGKFDSKKTSIVAIHQEMGISSARAGAGTGEHCINCETGEYENAHLPRILSQDAEYHMKSFLRSPNGRPQLLESLKIDGVFNYKIHVQNSCYADKFKPLFRKEGPQGKKYPKLIKEGLEEGLRCMEDLAFDAAGSVPSHRVEATNNLVKAVGGLIGYGFLEMKPGSNEDYKYDHYHGQKLSFICKADEGIQPPLNWLDNSGNLSAQAGYGAAAQSRTVFARATVAKRGNWNGRDGSDTQRVHENKVKSKYAAPNIVFNPNIAKLLQDDGPWKKEYNGQQRTDKFKELVFHEYLHTALGTKHTKNESSVDMAETCGDYCFHNPAGGDKIGIEIQRISGEICGGMHASSDPNYKAKMRRLKCLKRAKERNPNNISNELPPVRLESQGGCPAAPEGLPLSS